MVLQQNWFRNLKKGEIKVQMFRHCFLKIIAVTKLVFHIDEGILSHFVLFLSTGFQSSALN